MRVVINGTEQEIDPNSTVAALLARHKLQPNHVAVEINFDLVLRRDYDSTAVREGDRIEIVTLVGGG